MEPAVAWNVSTPHAVQLTALVVDENLPAGQATQRSGVGDELSASYVPGLHGCFTSQYGDAVSNMYLPEGQCLHSAELL